MEFLRTPENKGVNFSCDVTIVLKKFTNFYMKI